MPESANPSFDIREIPFSVRGSWLDISPVVGLHTSRPDLHLVTHQTGMHAVLRLVVEDAGERVETHFRTTASRLSWEAHDRVLVEAAFETEDSVRLRGAGCDMRLEDASGALTPFTGTYLFRDPIDGAAVFTSYESGRRYRITAIKGELAVEGDELLGHGDRAVVMAGADGWECVIEEFETARMPYRATASFDEVIERSARSFTGFVDRIAGWRDDSAPAAELAAYVIWSATVSPKGFLAREAVLMSKHWMDKVWSWDHCFNALALAEGESRLALDQFFIPFDHQDAAGGLPDSVTHSEVLYNFVKPPIHGWALTHLRSAVSIEGEDLQRVYDLLAKSTRFWLDFRRVPGHVVPHYQHGNDSGWDNSSTFDHDRVVEAPDLAGFLLVQLGVLADLADELGREDDWRRIGTELASAMVDELWDGSSFIARGATSGRPSKTSSLLNLLPIVAGELLPPAITDVLAREIETYLTDFGPATQLVGSDEYESDGYWRGPIWAPSTVLIEDGLRRSGYTEMADRVSERFRALCEKSGFAENFDALSGAGLRDRAYTWTAGAYLWLARAQSRRSLDA